MKYGLYAPIPMATVGSPEAARAVAESLNPLPPGARDAQFDLCEDVLLAADAIGFDLVLFAERHLGHDVSAWVMASALGSRFRNIRSLVAVHPGMWDPVMVAKLAVSLDRVCPGRMAINIVNGWFDREFEMFGGKVLKGEDRYRRTTEFIEILRGLWTQERVSYAGEFYRLDNAQLLLKPATPAPPELFSVSTSDRGRDFVASACDWWFVELPRSDDPAEALREIERHIGDMRARAARIGRTLRFALNPFLALGEDDRDAYETTLKQIYRFDPERAEVRMAPATRAGCIGTPAKVRAQVGRFADMGVELLLLKIIPTVENLRRIGAEIVNH
jgi:FMNH2-dependent dimethyl sulfone monooxygenase